REKRPKDVGATLVVALLPATRCQIGRPQGSPLQQAVWTTKAPGRSINPLPTLPRKRGRVGRGRAHMAPLRQEGIMSTTYRRGRTPSFDLVAGNGLINRRALLGKGIAVAGAMGAAGTVTGAAAEALKDEQWSLEFGSIMPPVQTASKYEKDVARTLSN